MPAGPQLAATETKRSVCIAALRPVYPGGSNVFAKAGLHVLPLAQGQRRAQHERHFKVAVNCSLRPGKSGGRHFELDSTGFAVD